MRALVSGRPIGRFIAPVFSILALSAFTVGVTGDEPTWAQWRGPARTATVEAKWPETLDEATLKQLWRVPAGPSYSGPVVSDRLVFTTETKAAKQEVVYAYDRQSGQLAWSQTWDGAMRVPFFAAANGSWIRATPAYHDGKLYVAGMRDLLVALDAGTGDVVWRMDFPAESNSPLPTFGFVSSPLVDGDDIYVQAGSAFVKLDRHSGKVQWKSLHDSGGMNGSAFSSPIIAEVAGVRQAVVQTRKRLAGVDLQTGQQLWSHNVPAFRGMNILTPVVHGDRIFTSTYRGKSFDYQVQRSGSEFQVNECWTARPQGYMSSPVLIDGFVYMHTKDGRYTCLDTESGKVRWTTRPYGKYCSMITNGELILALDQVGMLRLLRPNPERFELVAQRQVSDDETWAHIAIAGDQIFIREQNALAAYRWQAASASANQVSGL